MGTNLVFSELQEPFLIALAEIRKSYTKLAEEQPKIVSKAYVFPFLFSVGSIDKVN